MSVEFIGHVFPHEFSETIAATGPYIQPDYLRALAKAHEASGFDKVLIPHSSSMADGFILADQTLAATERLGVLLAHRPGFVAPTVAARKYATIDAFHPGRIALHTITGGDDVDQARDGDWLDKPARYRRSGEFLSVVKREWTSEAPFDHEGEFYRVKGGWSAVRTDRIPVYFGGASADAVRVAAEHADVYALWGEPLAGVRERIEQVQSAAAEHGRRLRFSVSLRPIVAATEEAAWERAREILRVTEERAGAFTKGFPTQRNEGSERLLRFAADRDVHDDRLFTALAKATGAAGNSTALVGTPSQVADALLAYVDAGASTLLIRGYEPYDDAVAYGEVISLVRERLLVPA
ncbi:LLM class flavin-dependent oxidoreductase [Solirubrobacter soli]|uniref:LLM class flavin-dependent oxidoreductase n=1 Tax=Solirubrobacter soli TaxID=363832 RepID=UPI000405132C|nr:LLM class flavin-dependent oxidoreductase [Solirubrobacter soli]